MMKAGGEGIFKRGVRSPCHGQSRRRSRTMHGRTEVHLPLVMGDVVSPALLDAPRICSAQLAARIERMRRQLALLRSEQQLKGAGRTSATDRPARHTGAARMVRWRCGMLARTHWRYFSSGHRSTFLLQPVLLRSHGGQRSLDAVGRSTFTGKGHHLSPSSRPDRWSSGICPITTLRQRGGPRRSHFWEARAGWLGTSRGTA